MRSFHMAALPLAALVLSACTTSQPSAPPTAAPPVVAAAPSWVTATPSYDPTVPLTRETQAALTPERALQRLKDGHQRFLSGRAVSRDFLRQIQQTAGGQYPMATILGCIDSRVPHEIIFDKGVGDIFSARIAGNFVNTDLLGSLEFASAVAGSKVIVVLGHTECGAIKGACDRVQLGNLTSTLANLYPAVYAAPPVDGPRTSANKAFVNAVTHTNVDLTVQQIVDRSPTLRGLVQEGKLMVIGAVHDVSTGRVEFRDDKAITQATLAAAR